MLSLCLSLLLDDGGRMTREEAWSWWEKVGAIKGVNYLPSTAGNSTEMWQASTFTPEVIEMELALAQRTGINAVRVFVQYIVWEDDPDGMLDRFNWFVTTAAKHGIRTMPVLFDDCAFGYPACKDPYLGPQGDPLPGEYSPYWTPSPGHALIDDEVHWPKLKSYVHAFVSEFREDERILMWDMYNEPGNGGVRSRSHELVLESIKWAREAKPSQPVTVGGYATDLTEKASQDFIEASDVVTFHTYTAPGQVRKMIDVCARSGRPILCTESVIRRGGNTYQNLLPIFSERSIGWFSWGLVNGRTHTYLHWGSRPGSPRPEVWQHDLYTPEYAPYDQEEIDMIRSFEFMRGSELLPQNSSWRYTHELPPPGWHAPAYAYSSSWKTGQAPFGTSDTTYLNPRTVWKTDHIWARTSFDVMKVPEGDLYLQVRHDEDIQVYINGVLALEIEGYNTDLEFFPVLPMAVKSLHAGENLIAVHVRQTTGGQGFDLRLREVTRGQGVLKRQSTDTGRGS